MAQTNKIHYLEIVTSSPAITISLQSKLHNVSFTSAPELGNAQVATMPDGSLMGIRAPLREDESSVVRPYFLVEDIEKAVKLAKETEGAVIAVPPMEIVGRGQCAIYILDGVEYGLWQI